MFLLLFFLLAGSTGTTNAVNSIKKSLAYICSYVCALLAHQMFLHSGRIDIEDPVIYASDGALAWALC